MLELCQEIETSVQLPDILLDWREVPAFYSTLDNGGVSPPQFTIRSAVASGKQTEISKIVNGNGD